VVDKSFTNGRVAALGSPYFTQAIVDHSPVIPEVKVHVDPVNHTGVIQLQYGVLNKGTIFKSISAVSPDRNHVAS